jgi:uncharacterized membrane protein
MKTFLAHLRDIAVSGFFALFPVYVLFIVISKALTALASVGTRISGLFGLKSILGVGGTTVFSGLLLIAIWIVAGLLVRLTFMNALSRALERGLSRVLPGYDTYKEMAEEKLQNKIRILPYTSALIRWQDYWQPGYIVEQDGDGNCVVFLPDIPETNKGRILLAKQDQVRMMSSVTATELDASLKKTGKGLLSEYGIRAA